MFLPSRFNVISRQPALLAWLLLAAVPILYVAFQIARASRDIVYWDEFSTLDFVLRLDGGTTWREAFEQIMAVDSEHRTVTSRLMFAVSYWLTGSVNFRVMCYLGNAFLLASCAMLAWSVPTWMQRARFAVVMALVLFQLEHFENFFWAGASIDHFQVVMLSIAAIFAVGRGTRAGAMAGGICATFATFTLAHGVLAWPACALLLVHQRRWRDLAIWGGAAVVVLTLFFTGFKIYPSHRIETLRDAWAAFQFWLVLLGAPPAMGLPTVALGLGITLLGGYGYVFARGVAMRHPVAIATALFTIAALALVAFGRAKLGASPESRYLVLGTIAWGVLIFLLIEMVTEPGKPFRELFWCLPGLAAFNIAANITFAPKGEGAVEIRDRAATRFVQFGRDGHGLFRLSPREGYADRVLTQAERRGVYRLPVLAEPRAFPRVEPNNDIIHHFDELISNQRAITIGGWVMLPGVRSKRGQIHIVLRSANSQHVFSTVTLQRPDVANAYQRPEWRLCGFRFTIPADKLPKENFTVGVLLADGERAELKMTPTRIIAQDNALMLDRMTGEE